MVSNTPKHLVIIYLVSKAGMISESEAAVGPALGLTKVTRGMALTIPAH